MLIFVVLVLDVGGLRVLVIRRIFGLCGIDWFVVWMNCDIGAGVWAELVCFVGLVELLLVM